MEDEKVEDLKPGTIGESSKETYQPETIQDTPIPTPVVADEVEGTVRSGIGNKVIDELGLVSTENFNTDDIDKAIGLNQQITTDGVDTDITDATFTFKLGRRTALLILTSVRFWVYNNGTGDHSGNAIIKIKIDGVEEKGAIRDTAAQIGSDGSGAVGLTNSSTYAIKTLDAGTHTIKLTGRIDFTNGTPALNIYNYRFSYIRLGT